MTGAPGDKHKRHINWIRGGLTVGVLLALMLVAQSVLNYYYVVRRLVPDHLAKQAERYATSLADSIQDKTPQDAEQARAFLQDNEQIHAVVETFRKEHSAEIAAIRLIENRRQTPTPPTAASAEQRVPPNPSTPVLLAQSGDFQRSKDVPVADVMRRFEPEMRSVIEDDFGLRSRTVVVAVSFRLPFVPSIPPQAGSAGSGGPFGGRPQPNFGPPRFGGQRGGTGRPEPARGARQRGGVRPPGPGLARPGAPPPPAPQLPQASTANPPAGPPDARAQAGAPASPPPAGRRGQRGRYTPRAVAEIALYLHGPADPLAPLRRDMEVSIAAAIALFAAVALLYLRLPAHLRGRELEQQLSVARQVQQELFPGANAAGQAMDFSAECVPIYEVGGDYYDIFTTSHRETALVVGDVSGKGLPAALLMALIHGSVRSGPNAPHHDHARTVSELNRMLFARLPGDRFVSLFWAYYDPESRSLRYVNAGHPPPLLFRHAAVGSGPHLAETALPVESLETGGPVLGVLRDARYESDAVVLNEDDLLVIYSDGLTEAWNHADEEFGVDRLRAVIARNASRAAGEIREAVLAEVRRFIGSAKLHDDLTLLVVRFGAISSAAVAAD